MRSRSLEVAVLALAVTFISGSGFAQEFPSKPLRIIVPEDSHWI